MDQNLTYIAYSRRSSEDYEDRQVESIESQERELREVKSRESLNIKGFISESKTAHKIGRPVFNQLLTDIEEGRVNAILTWHPNRLARNPYDAGRIIYLIDEGKLLEVRTPSRVFRNTPTDKFMLNLEFTISKKDSDDKSEVVKRGLKNKLLMGWRPGVAPHGYLNDRATESGHRRILTDPDRFDFLKRIFQLKYEGMPVRKILKIANDEWGFRTREKKRKPSVPLCISTLYAILKNPFYCGRYYYSGEWFEGKHEKAVEPEVFDHIQIMLGSKGLKAKPHTHEFSYTGLIRCGECNGVVTAEDKVQIMCSNCKFKFSITAKNNKECARCHLLIEDMINPKILNYTYYHCTKRVTPNCTQRSVEIKPLEEQIAFLLDSIEISDCFMDWAIRQINEDFDQERDFREEKIKSLRRTHDDYRQQLDNLLKLKISAGNTDGSLLSDDQFKAQKQVLETQLKNLDTHLLEVDDRMVKKIDEAKDKFDFAAHAKQRFDITKDLSVKREILSALGSNLTLKGKILDLQPHPHIKIIKEIRDEVPEVRRSFEPNKEGFTGAQLYALYASSPVVLRGVDSNH